MTSSKRRYVLGISGLTTLAVFAFCVSLFVGPAAVGLSDLAGFFGSAPSETGWLIFSEIRLPRAILGFAVGATLGLSGAALQGYLRNPLAEPGIIGVTASAALFAVIAFYTGLAASFALALPIGGILGAVAAVMLIQILAGRDSSVLTLILAGVAVTSFAGAMTSLALNLSPNPFAAYEVIFWMLGSLADRSFEHVWLAVPFMAVGWLMLLTLGNALNALTLGEDEAASLGFNLSRIRLRLVLGTALSVGAATAVSGAIGFVGLVVPHLLRPLVGHSPKLLLPVSALGGGILVLSADIIVRLLPFEREIKLGVLTAMIGAPFFLILLLKHRRNLL